MEKDDQILCMQIAFHMHSAIMGVNDIVYDNKADLDIMKETLEDEAANADTDEEEQLWGALLRYAGAIN